MIITSEQKQKILSTGIASIGVFLGFEALSFSVGIYQLKPALALSFYVYAFLIFWMTFLFDLHLKKRGVLATAKLNHKGLKMLWEAFKARVDHVRQWKYIRHYQNYLVLPAIIYWSTFILLFLNPFRSILKQLIVVSSSLAMAVTYWFMKEHISKQLEAHDSWIKILSLVKLFAAFLIYSSLIGVTFLYGYGLGFLLAGCFTVTFLLIYQALFQHNLLNFEILVWIVIISFAQALVALWVYTHWNSEYFTAGLVMLAFYNFFWGLLHHYLDKTLSKKVVWEYLLMMFLVVSFVLASHNFNQKVI